MIKAASLQTPEVDDIASACHELRSQLDAKLALLNHSVGIIQCSIEFIEAGIVPLLHKELGIPLVGGTTVATATNSGAERLLFSMLVLTSDDVEFTVSRTVGLAGDPVAAVADSLKAAIGDRSGQMRMALTFFPVFEDFSGDYYVDLMEAVCGNIPIFGTNLIDYKFPDFNYCLAICNDAVVSHEMTYVLLSGDVMPRFYIAAVPSRSNIETTAAVITKAKDNVVHEINGVPAIKYIESLWPHSGEPLANGADLLLPLLISIEDSCDNRPFVRALIKIDENGCAICSGRMPENAGIAFGSNSSADIISSTRDTVSRALCEDGISGALIFSCITRQIVIGSDYMKELRQLQSMIPETIPFMASYSGGEFAPTCISGANFAQNRYHNYSLIICLF